MMKNVEAPRQRALGSWSIRKKLTLFLLCAFLPAMTLAALSSLDSRREKIAEAERHATLLAQSIASHQERIAIATRQMLSTLAELPQVRELDAQACNELFVELQKKNPQYATIAMATPDGALFAGSQPFEPGSIQVGDRKHVKEALRTLDFSVGEYVVGRLSKTQSLNFTYPVLDSHQKLTAILIAGFKLDAYTTFIEQSKLPDGYAVSIMDYKGVRLFRWPESSAKPPGSSIEEATFELLKGGSDQGIFDTSSGPEERRTYAFKRLSLGKDDPPYLYITVGLSKNSIIEKANRHMLFHLLILGLATAMSAILPWIIVNLAVVSPIQALTSAVEQFGKGDLSVRTGVFYADDEVGRLSRSFDVMATLLERREKERDDAEIELSRANAALEMRIQERTVELIATNAALLAEIEERKSAESELLEQKELLDRTGKLAKVGSWQFDAISMQASGNDLTADILDLEGVPFHTNGPDFSYFEGSSLDAIEHAFNVAMEQAQPYDLELPIVTAGGAHKWIRIIGIPVVEDDRVIRIEGAIQDITDLQLARSQAEQREIVLSSIFQIIPDLFFLVDADGVIQDYRARDTADLYLPPEAFLGKHMGSVLPPEIAALFMEKIQAALSEGELLNFEYDMDLSGLARRFDCRLSRLGESRQCIAVIRDITQQHRDKQARIASEARFRDLMENAPFPIVITRLRDGVLHYVNRQAEILLRIGREQLTGRLMTEFYQDPSARPSLLETLHREESVFDIEQWLKSFDGQPFTALVSASVVEFENEPAIIASVNDITKRKNAEIALERERTWLRTLVKTIPDLMWAKSPEGVFLACNPMLERLLGAPEAEIIGKTDYDFMDKDLADFFRQNDRRAVEAGRPTSNEEWLRFADGGYRGLFETVKTPMYDSEGRLMGVMGVARDITESRRSRNNLLKRVREQRCLYEIFELTEDIESPLAERLQRAAELIGSGWSHPEIAAVRIQYDGQSYSTPAFVETPWMQHVEATTRQGRRISLSVAYLDEPQVEEALGTFLDEERTLAETIARRLVDVADRRQAAKSLKEREQLVSAMFAQTTESIILVDPVTTRFVDFNAAAHEGLGYTREEFSRLCVADIQAQHTVEQIAKKRMKSGFEEPTSFETRHRHKDGSLQDAILTLGSISMGGKTLICAVWRDVSEQKARERELKALAHRLQLHNRLLSSLNASESADRGEMAVFAGEATELLSGGLGIERVSVWLYSSDGLSLQCLDLYDAASRSHSRGRILEESQLRDELQALKTSLYLDVSDTLTDPRTASSLSSYLKPLGVVSLLECSIISGGENRGVIRFEHVERSHRWEADEITFGRQVADQLGMALLNKDRLEAVKALHQSETFLKQAQAVSHTGHWLLNIQNKDLICSDETYRIYGLSPSSRLTLEDFSRLIHPQDRRTVLEAWRQTLLGAPYHIAHRIVVDGETKWVEERAEIEMDSEGSPVAAIGIVQDITLHKMNEERLHRLNRIYAMVSRSNEALVRIRGVEASFQEICHIAVAVGGFQTAWIGRADEEGIIRLAAHAGEKCDYVERLKISIRDEGPTSRAFRTGRLHISNDIARDPAARPWRDELLSFGYRSSAVFPIVLSGKTEATFNVYSNIPGFFDAQEIEILERLTQNLGFALEFAAVEATAQKEQTFRQTLMESVAGLFYAFDSNGRLLLWNKHAQEVIQRSEEEISSMTAIEYFGGDEEALAASGIPQAFIEGESSGEAAISPKDGSRASYFFNNRRIAVDGRPLVVGTAVDITEKVRITRELEEYRLHLEDLVASRTAELEKAKVEAEAASQAKSSFLANMSHEIRTPLNAVIGFAHLMKRDPLTPRQLSQLSKMSNAAAHLLHIINDILDLSKIEASRMILDVRDFEPSRVIDHVCSIITEKASDKNLDLLVDLEGAPAMLRGDDLRLGQVLLNLVSNAVKFTEKGYVSIVARVVEEQEQSVVLRFEVKDSGIGMTTEQLGSIFHAFQQADGSMTRRFGGTGLGLIISKRITELMGGRIGVESEIGRGSLFWIEAPFEKSSQTPRMLSTLEALQGMRALVIDDFEDAREILASMLTELGMRVDAADSGEKGVAAALAADRSGDPYKLVLADWKMPGMNGIDVAHRLQSLRISSPPQYIMATSYGDQLPRDKAAPAGVAKVLTKPVTPSLLWDAISEILGPGQQNGDHFHAEALEEKLEQRRGAHILLVEDNIINQEVARQLLEFTGMEVSVAENGQSAVEMARETFYDLVLMDVQLPVMDGIQATQLIRRLPGWGAIPILAMTANVFEDDKERCLKAGMNDHVAKPVKPQRLQEVLVKWLPLRRSEAAEASELSRPGLGGAPEPHPTALLEQIDELDVSSALRSLSGDAQRYARLLEQFAQRHGNDAELLSRLIAAGEHEAVCHAAHSLKGVAGALGAYRVQQRASELETAAKSGAEANLLQERLEALASSLSRLVDALLAARLEAPAQEAQSSIDWSKVDEILAQIEPLLATYNTLVNDVFDQWGDLLIAALGGEAERLRRQIQEYEYAEAFKTLRAIRKRRQ